MSIYKQAAQAKLRFLTPKGSLSIEQLFDLTQTDLETSIKASKKLLKNDDVNDLEFLVGESKVDKTEQLRFDILKDVYLTKKDALAAQKDAIEKKKHNQKILDLIAEKKEEGLKSKSIEDLEKLLQD